MDIPRQNLAKSTTVQYCIWRIRVRTQQKTRQRQRDRKRTMAKMCRLTTKGTAKNKAKTGQGNSWAI
jgi:hypothetical protein